MSLRSFETVVAEWKALGEELVRSVPCAESLMDSVSRDYKRTMKLSERIRIQDLPSLVEHVHRLTGMGWKCTSAYRWEADLYYIIGKRGGLQMRSKCTVTPIPLTEAMCALEQEVSKPTPNYHLNMAAFQLLPPEGQELIRKKLSEFTSQEELETFVDRSVQMWHMCSIYYPDIPLVGCEIGIYSLNFDMNVEGVPLCMYYHY